MTNQIEKEFDLQIEELETIVTPGVATSPGPVLGGLVNHNETLVTDPALVLEFIEELEEKNAPSGVIVGSPFSSLKH